MERLSQKLEREAECSLCIERIKHPKILPCHHGFCCECLNKMAASRRQMNQTTFDCPECKAPYRLPENDCFDSFPSSFHHNRLLDLLALTEVDKSPQNCSSCEQREMDYCCDECKVCICAKCGISGHKDHVLIDIQAAATQNKQRIAEMLGRVKAGVRASKQSIERDKFNFKAADKHRDAVKSKISRRVQEMILVLRKREVELGKELDHLYEEQKQRHLVEQSELEMNLAALDSYLDYGEMLLRKNVTWELANLDQCVLQSGEELLESSIKGQGYNYVTGELVTNEKFLNTVRGGSFGRVVKSNTDPSCSIADGKGLHVAICGEQAEFVVVTKDSNRKTRYNEGDQISVNVTSIQGNEAEVEIDDCQDGSYRVTYVPRTHGYHLMTVKVKGRRLLCVPGVVDVTPHKYRADGSFGSYGSGKGHFALPAGIAVSSTGELAVADYGNGRVQLFTSDGKYLAEFGSRMSKPTSVAYTRADEIIVVDGGENAMSAALYTSKGVFLKEFGPSLSDSARSVSITTEGHVAVCEWENRSLKILSLDGQTLLRSFKGVDSAMFPSNVADLKNRYFAAYPLTGLIKVWNKAGKFLYDIGKPRAGMDGKLVGPLGLTVDAFGNLVVCESANNRLLVFSQDGHRLSTIGEPGTAPGQFKRPTDVAVGKDGRIYVVDQANHRIQIFKGFSFKSAAKSSTWPKSSFDSLRMRLFVATPDE